MQEKSRDVRTPNDTDLRKIGLNPNFWYPLAVAKNIKKGNVVASSFAGEPIALVRTESNQVYALEDRCAHRQMPLSCGIVQGEKLKCCYHGWLYDKHGQCVVPYLPEGVPCRTACGHIRVESPTAWYSYFPATRCLPTQYRCRIYLNFIRRTI
jgi:phenylpropionate dioxygenase-like ring-hydroxylating dioxygenase large terminal subunit